MVPGVIIEKFFRRTGPTWGSHPWPEGWAAFSVTDTEPDRLQKSIWLNILKHSCRKLFECAFWSQSLLYFLFLWYLLYLEDPSILGVENFRWLPRKQEDLKLFLSPIQYNIFLYFLIWSMLLKFKFNTVATNPNEMTHLGLQNTKIA